MNDSSISCVDFFCGAGGLTHGLIRGGIGVKVGIDIDPECRYPYEYNNGVRFIERDIRKVSSDEINRWLGINPISVIAGCAPCTPFSKLGSGERRSQESSKWSLSLDFLRLSIEVLPTIITMENVPQFTRSEIFTKFVDRLKSLDYQVWVDIVDCSTYGIPQTRKRMVLLASRLGPIAIARPDQFNFPVASVSTAIGHLSRIDAGESDPKDDLHRSPTLSEINLKRIQASKPNGTWRDWDESLLSACHRKSSGKTYPSVYGRMDWNSPAPTITTQSFAFGTGRFGHPEQNRAISLREAALLQTFPASYRFVREGTPIRFSQIGRLIGNAVPVRLGEVIAKSILLHVEESRLP